MSAEVQDFAGGFAQPPVQSAVAFRALMEAMARPGQVQKVAGASAPGLSVAASVLLLTLCDGDTGVWLSPAVDTVALRRWIAFHSSAPIVAPSEAQFAIGPWETFPLDQFPIGTPEYPDRSVTLIVEGAETAASLQATGPGIRDTADLHLPEAAAFERNAALFPLGLDFYFTAGDQLWALPRSTRLEALREVKG